MVYSLTFHESCIPGTMMLSLTRADCPMPLGYICFREVLANHVEILYMWVWPPIRRTGQCARMFEHLTAEYPKAVFITEEATPESRPFLEKAGFVKREDGWWREHKG